MIKAVSPNSTNFDNTKAHAQNAEAGLTSLLQIENPPLSTLYFISSQYFQVHMFKS